MGGGGCVIADYENGNPLAMRTNTHRKGGHVEGWFEGQRFSRVRWLGTNNGWLVIDRTRITRVDSDFMYLELEILFSANNVSKLSTFVLSPEFQPWANALRALSERLNCHRCPRAHYALQE